MYTTRRALRDVVGTGSVVDVTGRPVTSQIVSAVTLFEPKGRGTVGIYLEIGPPDPHRERLARQQGWVYLTVYPVDTRERIVGELVLRRREIEVTLGIRRVNLP